MVFSGSSSFSVGSSLAVTVKNKYVKGEVLFSSYESFFFHGVKETHKETLIQEFVFEM